MLLFRMRGEVPVEPSPTCAGALKSREGPEGVDTRGSLIAETGTAEPVVLVHSLPLLILMSVDEYLRKCLDDGDDEEESASPEVYREDRKLGWKEGIRSCTRRKVSNVQ